jgi:hypothetical protein
MKVHELENLKKYFQRKGQYDPRIEAQRLMPAYNTLMELITKIYFSDNS